MAAQSFTEPSCAGVSKLKIGLFVGAKEKGCENTVLEIKVVEEAVCLNVKGQDPETHVNLHTGPSPHLLE